MQIIFQARGWCASLPSTSSAHSTITSGLWPFPHAEYQSESKHVWVRFSCSAKADNVPFLHGKNNSSSHNRQMKGLKKATPGSDPMCLCWWTVLVSSFPTSLLPSWVTRPQQGWMQITLHATRVHKGCLCLRTKAQGSSHKSIRTTPLQCSTGCEPQAVLLWFCRVFWSKVRVLETLLKIVSNKTLG